jgi:hypothetical protein
MLVWHFWPAGWTVKMSNPLPQVARRKTFSAFHDVRNPGGSACPSVWAYPSNIIHPESSCTAFPPLLYSQFCLQEPASIWNAEISKLLPVQRMDASTRSRSIKTVGKRLWSWRPRPSSSVRPVAKLLKDRNLGSPVGKNGFCGTLWLTNILGLLGSCSVMVDTSQPLPIAGYRGAILSAGPVMLGRPPRVSSRGSTTLKLSASVEWIRYWDGHGDG